MSSTADSPSILFEWSCGEKLTADSMTDVVQQLLGDSYDPDDPEAALIERYDTLVDLAGKMQAIILASDTVNVTLCSEDHLTAALTAKSEHAPVTTWTADFPLILVASLYQPYTETPRPAGEVIVIDPHTEKSFLEAFTQLGLARLVTR